MGFLSKVKSFFSSEKKEVQNVEDPDVLNIDVKDARFIKMKCPWCKHKKARKNEKGDIICRKCHSKIGST
jgi:hypothetical protein